MLEHALEYAKRGWSVIPASGKRPLLDTWAEYQQRRATEEEIRAWWTRWPEAGIGVVTGKISGVVVVDIDSAEGLTALGSVPSTLTARTQRGGLHLYFRYAPGVLNHVGIYKGVDVRGDGGMVVAPPSRGEHGQYTWEGSESALAELPLALLALLRAPGAARRLEPKDWQADVTEGGRDQEMTRRCGRLLQVGMPAGEALAVMLAVNREHCKPPLEDAQIRKIVESIAGREAQKVAPVAAAPSKFTVMTQHAMLRRYSDDEGRWTVEDWLPEASCGLLVAPPGNYKTWVLTALAFAVATGRPFLDRYRVLGKGPVLFCQQEDPWWLLQSRLGRMFRPDAPQEEGPGYALDCRYVDEFDSMPVHWYTDRELHFSNKGTVAALEAKIAELRPRLVMIDPLYTAADSKDYMAEGAQKMAALKLIRDRYGCSFIIAHHTTVAGSSSEDRSSIWGSQFLNAWLEFGWRMPKGDDKGNVVVRHFKSAGDAKRIRLQFRITDWAFSADVDDAPASVADRVEEVIMAGSAGSLRALAAEVGCSISTMHKMVKQLGLEKNGEGHYRKPEK